MSSTYHLVAILSFSPVSKRRKYVSTEIHKHLVLCGGGVLCGGVASESLKCEGIRRTSGDTLDVGWRMPKDWARSSAFRSAASAGLGFPSFGYMPTNDR